MLRSVRSSSPLSCGAAVVGRERDAHQRCSRCEAGRLVARIEGRDAAADLAPDDPAGDVGDVVHGEPEVLEDRGARRRCAEVLDRHDRALVARPALPAQADPGLDRQPAPDGGRQDRVAVGRVLEVERLPAGERHDARARPFGLEAGRRLHRQAQLGAGGDEDEVDAVGAAGRFADDVAAAPDALGRRVGGLGVRRQLLAGEGEGHRPVAPLHGDPPRRGGLVGIAGPDEPQVRDRPQGRVVLDRLVGRSVLAQTHRVVRPDIDDVDPGQRGEAHGSAHVVAELEERRHVRDEPAVVGDPVADAAHRVLADAEAEVATGLVGGEVGAALDVGQVALREVRRAAEQLRHGSGERLDRRPG